MKENKEVTGKQGKDAEIEKRTKQRDVEGVKLRKKSRGKDTEIDIEKGRDRQIDRERQGKMDREQERIAKERQLGRD